MVWCVTCGQVLESVVQYCWRCGTKAHSDLDKSKRRNSESTSGSKSATVTCSEPLEVQFESTGCERDAQIQLSPGALQSFMSLKRKYENPGPIKARKSSKKAKTTSEEYITIGVQILDKDLKIVRKAFVNPLGLLSILQIRAKRTSSEDDWIGELKTMFSEKIAFATRLPTTEGFVKPCKKMMIKDLEKYRRQKKITQLRLFVVAEGKGKKDIKRAYKGAAKTIDEETNTEKQSENTLEESCCSDIMWEPVEKKRQTSDGSELLEIKEKITPPACNSLDILWEQVEEERPTSDESELLEIKEKSTPPASDSLDVLREQVEEKRTTTSDMSELLEIKETITPPACDTLDDLKEDHEFERFLRVHNKLEERKYESTKRIESTSLKKEKKFCIFYEARNNIGMSFKAPIKADIGYLYDMVCHLLEADVAAPKFHLSSGTTSFERQTCSKKLEEVPCVLQLIEDEFTPDDTITNYDDVIFANPDVE